MGESSLGSAVEWFRNQYADVSKLVDASCRKVNRSPSEVRIVAVTKYVDESVIPVLWQAGMTDFGENRWQQAKPKLATLLPGEPTWHFIGRLQQNKVAVVVRHFDWIHSVDSPELLLSIDRSCAKEGRTVQCLLQVNVSGEETKQGLSLDEVRALAKRAMDLHHVNVRGLMTMAPMARDMEDVRPIFRGLRDLLHEVARELGQADFNQLSMGMSGDFPVAVEEGATMIRVGRRLVVREGD